MIWLLLLLLLRIAWIVGASTPVRIVAIATIIVVVVAVVGTTLAATHRIALIGATLVGLLLLLLRVGATSSVRGLLRLGTTLARSGTRTSGLLSLLRLLLLVGLLLLGLLLLLLLAEEDTLLGGDGYASLEVTAQV